jgi:hypothetical protein
MADNHQEASRLHKQAASDHEDAAKNHIKAAECHDKNEAGQAKEHSKIAMNCCSSAQTASNSACGCSDKT